jgi:signal transduction histidine kinase/CheY-like chemotaxis protein
VLGDALAPFEMMLRGAREANALLKRLNATLEQRVQERTAALREADRRKDEFLAVLAHELRNPLAAVRNALQLMRLAGDDAGVVGPARDVLERQVRHLVRLIDDLMDVSRITRGKIELRTERLGLAAAVQSAVEISRPHIDAAGHTLEVALPAGPVDVQADPLRLAQVVANLLNNAAKYTEPGGRIWLSATREDDRAVLRVRDTGIGIPADMLPRVFDPFVQAPSAAGRAQGGVGIGLTLVKGLVELHGGSVEAHSAGPGQGSEFVVRLPLAPEGGEGRGAAPQAREQRPPTGPVALRVLVVDDNRDSAESLGTLLRLMGHEVRVVYDGPAALEAARAFGPAALVQDIEMPGMSGYEVARRLRAQPVTKVTLLVALTGYGGEDERRRCLEAGFDQHLVKPVDLDALQELLASLGPCP